MKSRQTAGGQFGLDQYQKPCKHWFKLLLYKYTLFMFKLLLTMSGTETT